MKTETEKPKRENPPNEKPVKVDLTFDELLKLAAETKSPTSRKARKE
jgi:hypothetical protein